MKVAIIGCGGMGNTHASAYMRIEGVTIVGVCDIDPDQLQMLADRTGATAYASFDEMLTESDCEVVSVTLPSHLHKEYTIRAARAGKHIICEKPIALNLEDAAEMIHVCEEQGVRLFVGHVVRFFPEYVQLRGKILQNVIGRVGVAHLKRVGSNPCHVRSWYADDSLSGGVVPDLMVHDLDFLRWTLGEVRSVYGVRKRSGDVDHSLATLIFESGAVANVEAYWGYPGPFTTAAEFAGSGGVIQVDSSKSVSLHIRKAATTESAGPFVEVPRSPSYHAPHQLQLQHYLKCLQEGNESIVTAHDAYKALELGLAVMESSESGRAIFLNQQAQEELQS